MLDLRHARHLLAVAPPATVQAAADAIRPSAPALTQTTARFEQDPEAKLFDRRARGLVDREGRSSSGSGLQRL